MATASSSEPFLDHPGDESSPNITSNASFDGRENPFQIKNKSRPASLLSRASGESTIELPDEVITTEGLRHSEIALNAKKYKTSSFLDRLMQILGELQVPTWSERPLSSNASISSRSSFNMSVAPPEKGDIWIHKVSGSLTNAVFFVLVPSTSREQITSFQSKAPYKTLLLRVYGPSSSSLINRSAELRILHVLSSRYRIGPRVWGTFANGRIEEYFESDPLTSSDIRDPHISRCIAVRMSELHRVDVRKVVDPKQWADPGDGTRGELGVKRNVRTWIPPARDVLSLIRNEEYKKEIDFELLVKQWDTYYKWVRDWEKEDDCLKESPRVFCHNDTQYGNLLRLRTTQPGMLPHQQIIVVDFEYASPNCAAFDIANHFCEWTTDYLGPNPALLKPSRFPTRAERDNFYLAYLQSGLVLDNRSSRADPETPTGSSGQLVDSPSSTPALSRHNSQAQISRHGSLTQMQSKTPPLAQFARRGSAVLPDAMDLLEEQVRRWMPASHGMWAIWALVQARDDVERINRRMEGKRQDGEEEEEDVMEFDYLLYASDRIRIFREACQELGVF